MRFQMHLTVWAAFSAALVFAGQAYAAGTIVEVQGPATIERSGKRIPAVQGLDLQAGDVVSTGDHGRVQFHMQDDSLFAVVPSSSFRIEEFKLARRKNDGAAAAVYSLLRGGLRTITGLIGKARNDTYELRTAAATIGIRGTTYAAVDCKGNCGKHKDGVYVKAENGVVIVSNSAGKLELKAGQVAYIASEGSAPVRVRISPFDDPQFAADFAIKVDFDFRVEPPRIEQEPPASPS